MVVADGAWRFVMVYEGIHLGTGSLPDYDG